MAKKLKALRTDSGMSTYTKLGYSPSEDKYLQESRHIGAKAKYTELTKDDVLMKMTMPPHPAESNSTFHEKNISKYLKEHQQPHWKQD